MLDILRSKTNHLVVYFILGAIILTFILGFGPASQKVGCGSSGDVLATIDGNKIVKQDWMYGLYFAGKLFPNAKGGAIEVRRFAMDKLIERELLQDLANQNGIHFAKEDAEDMVMANRIIIFGIEMRLSDLGAFPVDPKTKKPYGFNFDLFRRFVRSIGFPTEDQFLEQLVKEMEAKAYKDAALYGGVRSNRGEWLKYQTDSISFTYKSARFAPTSYTEGVRVSPAQIDQYLTTDAGKKAAEKEYNANKAKHSKGEPLRKALVLKMKIKMEGPLVNLFTDIQQQTARDLPSLTTALPQYKKVFDWLSTQKSGITLDNVQKAAKDMGEKGELKTYDFFGKNDPKVPAAIRAAAFRGRVGAGAQGPLFVADGAQLVLVSKEKFTQLKKEDATRNAARYLVSLVEAEKRAKDAAQRVLERLKKGEKPETIKELPEMITLGPINPISDDNRGMDRKLAKEIWSLKGEGSVLGRVVEVGKGALKSFTIYMLNERNLPSREDFDANEKRAHEQRVNAQAIEAFNQSIAALCSRNVKSLKFTRGFLQLFNYTRPANLTPEQLKDMPAEKYVPCLYLAK